MKTKLLPCPQLHQSHVLRLIDSFDPAVCESGRAIGSS